MRKNWKKQEDKKKKLKIIYLVMGAVGDGEVGDDKRRTSPPPPNDPHIL